MIKFNAVVVGDIPANRLMILTRPENEDADVVYIRISDELNSPEFVSSRSLKDGETVTVEITNNRIWKVEAGEDIEAGVPVISGKNGRIVRDIRGNDANPSWIGYTIESGKEGEVVKIIRRDTISLPWGRKIEEKTSSEQE